MTSEAGGVLCEAVDKQEDEVQTTSTKKRRMKYAFAGVYLEQSFLLCGV